MADDECTFSSDDIVKKSPNDRRLYRYIQLKNGLCALLVHDAEIYADGPPESSGSEDDDEEEDDEEKGEDDEEEDEDSDDSEGDEEEDGDDEEEDEMNQNGKKSASRSKKNASRSKKSTSKSKKKNEAEADVEELESDEDENDEETEGDDEDDGEENETKLNDRRGGSKSTRKSKDKEDHSDDDDEEEEEGEEEEEEGEEENETKGNDKKGGAKSTKKSKDKEDDSDDDVDDDDDGDEEENENDKKGASKTTKKSKAKEDEDEDEDDEYSESGDEEDGDDENDKKGVSKTTRKSKAKEVEDEDDEDSESDDEEDADGENDKKGASKTTKKSKAKEVEDEDDEDSESDGEEDGDDENDKKGYSKTKKKSIAEEDDEEEDSDEDEDDEKSKGDDDEDDEKSEGDDDEESENDEKGASQKKAAAAMCVGMGSFADPYEAQGLAHFLEHMLFMGSAEFPDENEYDSFLSKHGGSSNAYTETEHTCYYFDVKRERLKAALQRFSQFFISPLVKSEAMEREVLAVDSEFNQVLQNDSCRLQQLQCHTSVPGHTFNRFFWGNKKSLVDAMEKGVDLREQILKLYHENYHGSTMKLVVIGGETLDVLESWVLELFSSIKKGPSVKSESKSQVPIWEAGKLYRLEAVKDVHILDLSWTLPSLRKDYLKKAEDYLAHLLGHEGRGSLHFLLKDRGWVTTISAGVGDDLQRSSIAYIFGMSVHLTDSGLEKVFEIIGYVYQYVKLLRRDSPQEWIFKELQDIAHMEFRFAEEQPQDDYAVELAANLLVYPPEHVISGEYAYEIWDEKMIKYVLEYFRPDNMRIDVVTKSLDKSKNLQSEPWFGSQYLVEDVPSELLKLWKDPPEIDASLHLPAKNEFIPRDFSVHADEPSSISADASVPKCILDEPLMKLWYKLDTTFKHPRANTYFRITLKDGHSNLKNALLTELFIHLLKDELNEIVYQASISKLETSVALYSDKLELKVYGFSDKLSVLLSTIMVVSITFVPEDDRFKVIKEDMVRALRNTNMKPLNHASYLRLQVLCESFFDVDEKLSLLNDLSLADLRAFIPSLLSQVYIEGLCHGNLLEEEALTISKIFKGNFTVPPLPDKMRHRESVMSLPSSADLVRDVQVKNKLETNSVVELYFQIEPEVGEELIKLKALVDLFDEIIEEPLFNQLRTKEQLGYVVDCSPRVTYRIMGFCFRVQSSEYDPVHLQGRIDNFINSVEEMLEELDDRSFENYKNGLIAKLLEKDPSLQYETNRYWSQIVDKRYMFDMSAKEAEELKSIEKKDVIDWYHTYLTRSSPKCRRLAIRVWGCNTDWKKAKTSAGSAHVITDVGAFKKSSEFYPSLG